MCVWRKSKRDRGEKLRKENIDEGSEKIYRYGLILEARAREREIADFRH